MPRLRGAHGSLVKGGVRASNTALLSQYETTYHLTFSSCNLIIHHQIGILVYTAMVLKQQEIVSKRTDMSIPGRKEVLRLRVVPGTTDRLDKIAALFGLPSSTLAALAVGEWITNKESSLGMTQKISDSVAATVGVELGKQFEIMMKADAVKDEKSA